MPVLATHVVRDAVPRTRLSRFFNLESYAMMPSNNPFLEGYVSVILGKRGACPYVPNTPEYERWCRGFGGAPVAKVAAAKKPIRIPTLEGRRPYVEGYRCAIMGRSDVCPYEDGTPECERWWSGYRGRIAAKGISWDHGGRKSLSTPTIEGRRPYVEGYKSAILGKRDVCPYEEDTSESERWQKGFAWWATATPSAGLSARR
jgi:ribosome modulation factor